jgi:hypothetical protein
VRRCTELSRDIGKRTVLPRNFSGGLGGLRIQTKKETSADVNLGPGHVGARYTPVKALF